MNCVNIRMHDVTIKINRINIASCITYSYFKQNPNLAYTKTQSFKLYLIFHNTKRNTSPEEKLTFQRDNNVCVPHNVHSKTVAFTALDVSTSSSNYSFIFKKINSYTY